MAVKNLKRNAIFNGAEALIYGLGLFFIYRNVVAELGVAMVGVWSIVLSTTAFGRLADTGIAPGMARFIARALSEGSPEKAVLYMRTGAIAVAVFMAGIILLFWWGFWLALDIPLDGDELVLARDILPFAMISFWLIQMKVMLDACLMGVHRADLRAVSNIVGMAFQVIASLVLVKDHGLYGLAWAQAGQFFIAFLLAAGFIATIAQAAPGVRVRGWFSWPLLKELLGFGIKLQIGTVANLMFEPACKIVLGTVAGTTVLGVFEMAHRMIYQVRGIAFMALQTTIPAFADLDNRDPQQLQRLFGKVCKTGALAGAGIMLMAVLGAPVVSWLWFGELNWMFVCISSIAAIGWSINILAAPAYFLGMADGRVMPNVLGLVLTGLLAPLSVYFFGIWFGPLAAILGMALGRYPGDLLPAFLVRPNNSWRYAAVTNTYLIGALVLVLSTCAAMISLSLRYI